MSSGTHHLLGSESYYHHICNKGMLCLLDPPQQQRLPVPCDLPTRPAGHGLMPQEHVFMTVLPGRNSRNSQKPAPFLNFNKSCTKWMFVRTHIAFGTLTARGLGNGGFSFSAFQEGTLEGEWNEIIYHMHHLLNRLCPMDPLA